VRVIEYARNACGMDDADSTEFNEETRHKVVYKLRDLLGSRRWADDAARQYVCRLAPGLRGQGYGKTEISERHATVTRSTRSTWGGSSRPA